MGVRSVFLAVCVELLDFLWAWHDNRWAQQPVLQPCRIGDSCLLLWWPRKIGRLRWRTRENGSVGEGAAVVACPGEAIAFVSWIFIHVRQTWIRYTELSDASGLLGSKARCNRLSGRNYCWPHQQTQSQVALISWCAWCPCTLLLFGMLLTLLKCTADNNVDTSRTTEISNSIVIFVKGFKH